MEKFTGITSQAIGLDMHHVDTDMIIPAQYLTQIERNGYGEYLFQRLREQDADFIFNDLRYQSAKVLLTRSNFGCGSSREHAIWALMQAGIRVIVAESYSDIFYNNAVKNGLLLISIEAKIINALIEKSKQAMLMISVDLHEQFIMTSTGERFSFDYEPFRKACLLKGQDDLDYLLEATR